MRRYRLSLLAVAIAGIYGCSKSEDEGERYIAPRNLGESIETWSSGQQGMGSCAVEVLGDEKYCTPGHLEKIDTSPSGKVFIALVDWDYDYRDVTSIENSTPYVTRMKVRKVIEEYWNLLPEGRFDEMYFFGTCDEKGHCLHAERHAVPLWSGVNYVHGFRFCVKDKVIVFIWAAYAVEDGLIYDYFGKSGPFEDIRAQVIANVANWKEPPSQAQLCTPDDESTYNNEGTSNEIDPGTVIIAPEPSP